MMRLNLQFFGGRGSAGGKSGSGKRVTGVSGSIAKQYMNSEFTKNVNEIEVHPIKKTEFILSSWDGTPNDLHKESANILNSYVEKNSLKPTKMEVNRQSVAMNMSDGSRLSTMLAEPTGLSRKNMSSYIRLYKTSGGKKKQIKKSEW